MCIVFVGKIIWHILIIYDDREVKTRHNVCNAMNERWQHSSVDRLRKPEQLWGQFEVSTGDCSGATVLEQANRLVYFHLTFFVGYC